MVSAGALAALWSAALVSVCETRATRAGGRESLLVSGSNSYSFGSDINLSWYTNGPNISFSMECFPSATQGALSWCAFGINTDGKDGMYPAECFWAGIDASGEPYLEDRITSKKDIPPCATTQLSHLTASKVTTSSLVVNFTRPLSVNSGLEKQGYTSIPDKPVEVIAASATGPRQAVSCDMVEAEHYVHYHKIQINFAA
jgi:hypothetical protein